MTRALEYDAFLSFCFDKDHELVQNIRLCLKLVEHRDPPFKLCIHSEDFIPGSNILDNITEPITRSNTAIIVLSQEFIDSPWCQKEFEYCIVENINDPAFRLFVILMEKLDQLENLSPNMSNFMKQKTYLERTDPKLFDKIADCLRKVKEPKVDVKKRKKQKRRKNNKRNEVVNEADKDTMIPLKDIRFL